MKICPVGGELLLSDGQTDMSKSNSLFSKFFESV